jgi:hypothetical protein
VQSEELNKAKLKALESEAARNYAEQEKLQKETEKIALDNRANFLGLSFTSLLKIVIAGIVAGLLVWSFGLDHMLKVNTMNVALKESLEEDKIKLIMQNEEQSKILSERKKEIEKLEQLVFSDQAKLVSQDLNKKEIKTLKSQLLRSEPKILSSNEIFIMVGEKSLSLPGQKIKGYFKHNYEPKIINDDEVIIDHATGLTWQKSGSPTTMTWEQTNKYIDNLNSSKLAGYTDWRVPTIEELASLVEVEMKNKDLYIDPLFSNTQRWCGSSDKSDDYYFWGITLYEGKLYRHAPDFKYYYRAVRSNYKANN